jgi:dCMP deaminase
MNPKFHRYFMDVALRTAELSYALRLKVGAVAVKDRRIIACGYNGTAPGEDNCCEYGGGLGELVTKESVLHAEANLIAFAKREGISLVGCTLYITHSPCEDCAKLVVEVGFKEVIFNEYYRTISGRNFLEKNGVRVFMGILKEYEVLSNG